MTPRAPQRLRERQGSIDDRSGNLDQANVVVAGVLAHPGEGLLHSDAGPFGEHALGLLDCHAVCGRGVELLNHAVGVDEL